MASKSTNRKKKTPARKRTTRTARSAAGNGSLRSALGILVMGLGLLGLACLIVPSNALLLLWVRREIQGLMGNLSFMLPALVFWSGLLLAFSARNNVRLSSIALATLLIVCFATLLQIAKFNRIETLLMGEGRLFTYHNFLWKSYNASVSVPYGGGILGAVLAYPLTRAMDSWGASLLLLFVMGADLVLLFRVSMASVGEKVGDWAQQAMEQAKERYQESREERLRRREERLEAALEEEMIEEDEPAPEPEPKPPAKKRAPEVSLPAIKPQEPKVLYLEDIVSQTAASEKGGKRRRKNALPEYLEPQKAAFAVYDQLPIAEAREGAPAVPQDDDLPPWEPLDPQLETPEIQETPEAELPLDTPALEEELPKEALTPAAEAPAPAAIAPPAPPAAFGAGKTLRGPLDWIPEPNALTRLDRPDFVAVTETPEPHPMEPESQYRQPPYQLLDQPKADAKQDTNELDRANAQKLEECLLSFGVTAHVIHVTHGPAITRYELQPAPGVKVSRIVGLTDDIALNMAAFGVRIEAPIPGKAAIGIEIPNEKISMVMLREVLESDDAQRNPSKLAVALGKDIAGKRIIADLARMPHVLIAGATGSGKSVCINTIITSIIYRATPAEVRLILVDPKVVELSVYNGIPHLLVPVVTEPKKASGALNWAVMEMDERYKKFATRGVRDIRGFNARREPEEPLMPQIVVIIDELADLMLVAPGEVEESICRLAQLARAAGIHLVIATQRPSVNVITGVIKSNIPSRIAFAVASQVDARTILDTSGAEKLLGKGDMLYAPSGGGKPIRVQGCFVSDQEVARVVDYVKERHEVEYNERIIEHLEQDEETPPPDEDDNDSDVDELLEQAVEMAVESGQASISMLQRRLRVGYARAGRLIDEMSRRNIIAQAEGAKPRQVLITMEDFRKMFP